MTNNPWQTLNFNFQVSGDSFNDVVPGSGYLDIGLHEDVFIEGVELATARTGRSYVKVIWSNDEGQKITDAVFIEGKPDDSGTMQPHFTFKRLMSAVCPDVEQRLQFVNLIKKYPQTLSSLAGLRATIKIVEGKTGYTIKDAPTGGKFLYDVETKDTIGSAVYDDYKQAAEAAKELGLQRAYNNIGHITSSQKSAEKNAAAIQTIIKAGANAPSGNSTMRPVSVGSL